MSRISEAEFQALQACPHLSGLRDLSLQENAILPQWLPSLLAGEQLPELKGLDFSDIAHLGLGLAIAFSQWNHRDIRRLNIAGVAFSSDQLRQVLTSRCLRNVEELRLGHVGFARSVGPLFHITPAWVIPWKQLVILDVKGQRLGNDVVGEMLADTHTAAVRSLGLAFNGLDAGIVKHFTDAKHLQLNHLDLRGNNFTPSGLAALKQRFPDAFIEV